MVPGPKKKACPGSCRVRRSPAPKNTVITGTLCFRALRPAAVRLSGQMCSHLGRLGFCAWGRRTEVAQTRHESTARYRRRRTVEQPAFSHRSPAPGAGLMRPGFGRAFFFGSPKPFLFGPLQKEMGSGNSSPFLISPVQGRGRDHFFFGEICLPR